MMSKISKQIYRKINFSGQEWQVDKNQVHLER